VEADTRRALKSLYSVAYLYHTTNLLMQPTIFHRQTIVHIRDQWHSRRGGGYINIWPTILCNTTCLRLLLISALLSHVTATLSIGTSHLAQIYVTSLTKYSYYQFLFWLTSQISRVESRLGLVLKAETLGFCRRFYRPN